MDSARFATLVRIDASTIADADSFHVAFAAAFGFPAFYGRNMDAWIDCMSDLDEPAAGMSALHVARGHTLALVVEHAGDFRARCPALFTALVDAAAFVNWRRLERGRPALLALAFHI